MKTVLLLIATFCTLAANAGDRKLGNIIAVEREIPNVYESCVKNTRNEGLNQDTYMCTIKYTKASIEIPVSTSGSFDYKANGCVVNSDIGNGKVLIAYGPERGKMSFDEAKNCLAAAVDKAGTFKVIVYTVE